MINYIKGIIADLSDREIIVESGGIGYEINATGGCIRNAIIGAEIKINVYMCVREDAITLYGFKDKDEKNLFLKLIEVSGIGPKVAVGVLSGISTNELLIAIATSDVNKLSKLKGIGKKTAERIVLELKDKLKVDLSVGAVIEEQQPADEDAVLALISLGYTKQESINAVSKVQREGLSTEQIIMSALKGI